MRRNNQTLMSVRERLFAAIAFTFLLAVYQQILRGKPESFAQTISKIFPAVSSSTIFPEYKFILLP